MRRGNEGVGSPQRLGHLDPDGRLCCSGGKRCSRGPASSRGGDRYSVFYPGGQPWKWRPAGRRSGLLLGPVPAAWQRNPQAPAVLGEGHIGDPIPGGHYLDRFCPDLFIENQSVILCACVPVLHRHASGHVFVKCSQAGVLSDCFSRTVDGRGLATAAIPAGEPAEIRKRDYTPSVRETAHDDEAYWASLSGRTQSAAIFYYLVLCGDNQGYGGQGNSRCPVLVCGSLVCPDRPVDY